MRRRPRVLLPLNPGYARHHTPLRRCGAEADRAAHAGAAEAAIAERVLGEILLVIVLGVVERRRVTDLRGDGAVALGLELLLVHRKRRLGGAPLLGTGDVDAGAILRPDVVALAHALGGIVVLPERPEEALVGDLL